MICHKDIPLVLLLSLAAGTINGMSVSRPLAMESKMVRICTPAPEPGTRVTLNSPGWNTVGGYDHHTDCEWTLKVTGGSDSDVMKLQFDNLDLEPDPRCNYDYVLIFDNVSGRFMGKFCGSNCAGSTIVLESREARVVFRSDGSTNGGGFSLRAWRAAPSNEPGVSCACAGPSQGCVTCGGVRTSASGVIESLFFEDPSIKYPDSLSCSWGLLPFTNQHLKLTFESLDLESHSTCRFDAVKIYKPGQTDPLLVACGNVCSPTLLLNSSAALVVFKTDHSQGRNGFRLRYETVSPNTESSVMCQCGVGEGCISSSAGVSVRSTTTTTTTMASTTTPSATTTTTMPSTTTTTTTMASTTTPTATTTTTTPSTTTTTTTMASTTTATSTHPGPTYGGPTEKCGGTLTATEGTIKSPNYPASYPNNKDCTWTITVEEGKFIELDKEAFDLETVSNCRYDSLTFYDGTESSNIWNLKYCGERFPGTLTSSGNTVTLVFHSDSSVADTGFKISYRTVEVLPEEDPDQDDVSCGVVPRSRIVGGQDADAHAHPWQIKLRRNGRSRCGGTLVDNDWVITAAHCVDGGSPASAFSIDAGIHRGGEQSLQTRTVAEVFMHPLFVSASQGHDIALLKLTSPVTWSEQVRPACVPSVAPDVGDVCVITGWGDTEAEYTATLQEATVPVLSNQECHQRYSTNGGTITDNMMCAGYFEGGVDTCQGDSGGPLACAYEGVHYLHGVTSWGFGCADPNFPGVYARVAYYSDWISAVSRGDIFLS